MYIYALIIKQSNRFFTCFRRPFWNFSIGFSASASRHLYCKNFIFALQIFLWKNKISISNTPQYSFLNLVTRHQYHFATITHFSTIFFSTSTKVIQKNIHGGVILSAFASHAGSFGCCIQQLFCRETVNSCPVSIKGDSTEDVIWGVQKGTQLEITFWNFSVGFKAPLRNLVWILL